MRRLPVSRAAALALVALLCATSPARADIEHVVSKGHTLTAIANRYQVSVRSILERNNLRKNTTLQLGQVLVIPGVGDKTNARGGKGGTTAKPAEGKGTQKFAARAKNPGVVRVRRLATNEDFVLQVGRGKRIGPVTLKKAKAMFRSTDGQTHAIDARLLSLLGTVSDHFGSRPIEVISGFRPYRTTQHTKDSRHNHGKAVDFRVVGVPNTVVRDFCRTLRNTGCGFYPNSTFIHMDVRDAPAYWVDYSRPGERPQYRKPGDPPATDADERIADVHTEGTSDMIPASVAAPSVAAQGNDTE